MSDFVTVRTDELYIKGVSYNVTGVLVDEKDIYSKVVRCHGAVAPPSAMPGYQVGCTYRDTANGVIYVNVGTTTSCKFVPGPYLVDTTNGKTYYLQTANGILQLVEVV
jgi:hypothetical protein